MSSPMARSAAARHGRAERIADAREAGRTFREALEARTGDTGYCRAPYEEEDF